jgi:uncharacterized membrane protein YeaQ/YmgE (transglycosylase-associated protein family)
MEAFLEGARQWSNTVLVWIGFGTVVGLIAKALMPGRDQGGAVATLLIGIAGTIVGMGAIAYFWDGHRATPVSLLGFVAAVGGSFLLLFCHRMLQGAFFREEGTGPVVPHPKRRRRPAVVIHQK